MMILIRMTIFKSSISSSLQFKKVRRELTTLQSILADQIESHGKFVFKEGSVVIPGQVSLQTDYFSLQLASTFAGEILF